jgi:hypothetical protein
MDPSQRSAAERSGSVLAVLAKMRAGLRAGCRRVGPTEA